MRRAACALLAAAALAVSAIGLGGCYSRGEAANDADSVCAEHDGVARFFYATGPEEAEVTCKDGLFEVLPLH